MRLSYIAKILNRQPKKDSKSHKVKEAKWDEIMKGKIVCEKCKESKTTLYKINEHYYCKNCKEKKDE